MNATQLLISEMAYIQGSLCRVNRGESVRFRFYSMQWKLFLYACRAFELTVDGILVDNAALSLRWNGKTYRVDRIAGSDCSVPEGEVVEVVLADGGCFKEDEPHRVEARFKSGGDYGFDASAEWIPLVAFTDKLNSKHKDAFARHTS